MLGTIVNALAIIVGGIIGLLFKNVIPEKISESLLKTTGLAVIAIGITLIFRGENLTLLIISLILGTIIGETIDIEGMLENADDGDTVTISESDKEVITQAFIKKVADKKGIRLALNKEYGDFCGGVILTNKGCSKNMTLELELASVRENREAKIAKMIFEEK